jgi:predicted LPLAT superfamily acyltransferase
MAESAEQITGSLADKIEKPNTPWRGKTLGGEWFFRFCFTALPFAGLAGAWIVAWIIALGFFLCAPRSLFGMRDYWRRMKPGWGATQHSLLAIRQFASFGRILCDRLLVIIQPQRFHIKPIGIASMRRLRNDNKGCILISAHVGNWEVSSYWLRTLAGNVGKVHVVMVRNEIALAQQLADRYLRSGNINVIDPRDGIGASLAINEAIRAGDMVCMLADRVFANQPAVTVQFMGGSVQLPLGPFQAAALTGAPILVGFLNKTGYNSYVVQVDEPWYINMPAKRSERAAVLHAAVQRWAKRLERQVRRFPFQWHNFFPYWVMPINVRKKIEHRAPGDQRKTGEYVVS